MASTRIVQHIQAARADVYRALIDPLAVHHGLLLGLSVADNELGWRLSLAKLAAFVEGRV